MQLHSSVGRASNWYLGGHEFEFCWSREFFRLLSNCLNWKFTVMIILHIHLQLQFKYELCLCFTSYFASRRYFCLSSLKPQHVTYKLLSKGAVHTRKLCKRLGSRYPARQVTFSEQKEKPGQFSPWTLLSFHPKAHTGAESGRAKREILLSPPLPRLPKHGSGQKQPEC